MNGDGWRGKGSALLRRIGAAHCVVFARQQSRGRSPEAHDWV